MLPESRDDERLSKLYRFQPVRCESKTEKIFDIFLFFSVAAEQSEAERRETIDQKQVLKGTSTTRSEISWSPGTFVNDKKKLSAALGIVRNVDKTSTISTETPKTVLSKSLVSYDEDDEDSS